MILERGEPAELQSRGLPGVVWLLCFGLLVGWIAYRLGAFDLWATVPRLDGSSIRIPDTFAAVDHPFHATRAETLRRSLADGDLLRWVGSHQGGYPVEFYPIGAPWIEVIVWSLAFGSLPMMAIHKLVVIGVFVLPVAGFAVLARFGGLPWSVPFLALAMHLSVRGWWWSGGYMELIEWGLLTNVLSAALLPLLLGLLWRYAQVGATYLLVASAIAASLALYTNVRSVIPIVAIVAGTALSHAIQAGLDRSAWRRDWGVRIALAAGLTILLVAPLMIALLRFSDLYVFVRYSSYPDLTAYWDSSLQAVSSPMFCLTVAGAVFAAFRGGRDGSRVVLSVLAMYVAGTALVVLSETAANLVSQLEATRLMPFQRLLMLYLAAYGAWRLIAAGMRAAPKLPSYAAEVAMLGLAILVLSAYLLGWVPGIPESDRADGGIVTTGQPSMAELEAAVELADREAPPATTLLVLGGVISWHDQLWSPQWSDRRFFYDDWLWYWQTDHVGDYDPQRAHAYSDDASALQPGFLQQHAIGAVVVTGDAADDAARSPHLTALQTGTWSAYLVNDPQPVILSEQGSVRDQQLSDSSLSGLAGEPVTRFEIRHNWYPRWSATVDGDVAEISRNDAGYMTVTVAESGTELELTYGVDAWDWLGRVLFLGGVLLSAFALIWGRNSRWQLVGLNGPG